MQSQIYKYKTDNCQQGSKIKIGVSFMAIDLIVQHIRDFLNNRSRHGSTGNMALYMNLDLNATGAGFAGPDGNERHLGTYNAIRRFSTLCKELNMQGNFFFETNKNLPYH